MPQYSGPYLIIAQSGRALAESAYKAGIKTHVIDRFADTDTKKYALSTRVVNESESGICVDHLKTLLTEYNPAQIQGVVTGSGFESQPEILAELEEQFTLIGNSTTCVKACKDPALFFPLLESLGIPYPEISLQPPNEEQGWLIKKAGGTGGQHIYRANGNQLPDNHYFQKFIQGRTISVTFLANGRNVNVIGINETWTVDENNNFSFAGAASIPEDTSALKTTLIEFVKLLTEKLHLLGLCGMDVIVDKNNNFYILEINPRPVSTVELYDINGFLFRAHIEACKGKLLKTEKHEMNISRGLETKYHNHDLKVPDITWPEWVSDCPVTGLNIASGKPICTIHAAASSSEETRELLKQRKVIINKLLGLEKIAA